MAFAHKDYYHSPMTLKRVSEKLERDGLITNTAKKKLDFYIDEAERFKIGQKPFVEEKESTHKHRDEEQERQSKRRYSGKAGVVKKMNAYVKKDLYGEDHVEDAEQDVHFLEKARKKTSHIVQALGRYVALGSNPTKRKEELNKVLGVLKGEIRDMKNIGKDSKKVTQESHRRSKRAIYFEDLKANEKEKYMNFLVENKVKFFKTIETRVDKDTGERKEVPYYTATICLVPESTAMRTKTKAIAKKQTPSKAEQRKAADNMTRGKHSRAHLFSHHVGRPPAEEARMISALNSGEDEFASYQTFSKLITLKNELKPPKKRPVTWLMRLIEEIYDARFIHDSADFKDEEPVDKEYAEAAKDRLSRQFPIFLVDFFSKRYGVRIIVDQNCWDLLFNVNLYREKFLEVAIFGRFLEEFYDPDDLLFFLYVRSIIQKEIGINFRNHWNELGRKSLEETVWLSYSSCVKVSRVVFVSESDPLFRVFMDMIEAKDPETGKYKHLVGSVSRKRDTRRIKVINFLHLALAEYHSTRPAEGEEEAAIQTARAEREAGEDSLGVGGRVLVQSKAEQERLYQEAEAHFERSQRAIGNNTSADGAGEDGSRQQRIEELEERIRAEISKRRAETPGYTPAVDDEGFNEDDAGDDDEKQAGVLIDAISDAIVRCNAYYLDRLMKTHCEDTDLPREIKEEIRREVQLQLEAKVDMTLEAVVDLAMDDNDHDNNELVKKFRVCRRLPEGQSFRRKVEDFCSDVVECEDVREEIEPLISLLVNYAMQNYEAREDVDEDQDEDEGDDHMRGRENIHISRSGSVDIRMS